jgi:biopolymer transport protein ExbD
MAVKVPEVESLGMNMTPMIDIVFNLVQFFMLTLDLSHKELAVLDLPRALNGVEDKDPSTDPNAKPEDKNRFTVNLEAKGSIYFKGHSWPLAGSDPQAQEQSLDNLRKELRVLASSVGRERDTGASKAMLLVRGDRTAKWRYVQWVMQVCADPQIKIYKMHFAVEHKKAD